MHTICIELHLGEWRDDSSDRTARRIADTIRNSVSSARIHGSQSASIGQRCTALDEAGHMPWRLPQCQR